MVRSCVPPILSNSLPMPDVSSTIGGIFFGYIVSLVLLGITIVQSWVYFHSNRDKWPLRTFMAMLVLLDLAETICTTQVIYYYLISHFGDLGALKSPISLISVEFLITTVIFFMVHLFFALRLWKLGKDWRLPITIAITSTTMLVVNASAILSLLSRHLLPNNVYREIEPTIFHALAVVTDILTTIGLFWTLSKTDAGFKNTRTVLQYLLAFTLTRGILISLVQVAHITMYALGPANVLFWISLHIILTKLYVLSTLATLNSRESLRDILEGVNLDDFYLSSTRPESGAETTRYAGEMMNVKVMAEYRSYSVCPQCSSGSHLPTPV